MKRRLLSMVMAFAMVLSLIPAVHAADAAGSDLIELLPGDETVKEALGGSWTEAFRATKIAFRRSGI